MELMKIAAKVFKFIYINLFTQMTFSYKQRFTAVQ